MCGSKDGTRAVHRARGDGRNEERVERDALRAVAAIHRELAENRVEAVAKAGAETEQDAGNRERRLASEHARHEHAAEERQHERAELPPRERFAEEDARQHHDEGRRRIEQHGGARERHHLDSCEVAVIEEDDAA